MSMLGLSVGTTDVICIACVSKNRVRISLLFDPTISFSIGAPICFAIQPASTLPKLPVGTLNEALRPNA